MQKNAKRGSTQGFDGVTGEKTANRLKLWKKNNVSLGWRKWEVEKIRFTYMVKTISYGENVWSQKFIAPYGMKDSIKKRKLDSRGRSSLPGNAKQTLYLPEHYDINDVVIECADEGDQGYKEFYVVYCQKCHTSDGGYMKHFTTEYKDCLPSDPKIKDIMENWDKISKEHPSVMKYIDVAGCILPHEPTVDASPNESHYIVKPADHADSKCHKWTCTDPSSSSIPFDEVQILETVGSSPTSSQKPVSSSLTSPTATKKQKTLTVALDGSLTAEKTVKVHNTKRPGGKGNSTITVKNQKQLVFKPITALLDPTVSLKKNATDTMGKASQNACFSFVISGCSKEVSNNTTIEFYEKHVFHLRKHHQENVGHLQIDNKVLPKPLRAQLDKSNIKKVHAALVISYKQLQSSSSNPVLYKPFAGDNVPICIYIDGIQKFGKELNGAYARTAELTKI